MSESTMITDIGALKITIQPEDVTWFQFLEFSRLERAIDGGWDSKTRWKEALRFLGGEGAGFIKQWTATSLAANEPVPRTKDFMLGRESSPERVLKDCGRLMKGTDFSKRSENEINARLFFHDDSHGLWTSIGYEVPLAEASAGQLKMDILALGKARNSLAVIELKQANNTGDSPLMALTEAICYSIQVVRCRDALCKALCDNPVVKSLESELVTVNRFKTLEIILAAPQAYWRYWQWDDSLLEPMQNIIASVNRLLASQGTGSLLNGPSFCHLETALV